jgi:hypothetical protein
MGEEFDKNKLYWFNPQKEKSKCSNKDEFISVSTKHASNRIYFNSALVKNYFIDCPGYLRFGFYDNRYLILECTNSNDELGYPAKKQGNKTSESKVVISSPLVAKITEISGQKANTVKRYKASFNEEYNSVYVDLKQ